MRRFVALVISSKGGVGKSAIAMQILTPYLFIKNDFKKIAFYECDDENCDSYSFGASLLSDRAIIKASDPYLHRHICEIFFQDRPICIDVGGNKTTPIFLDALSKSGMIEFVDVAVVPLLDGEQDAINATIVYSQLRSMRPDLPIVFALNRLKPGADPKKQFENFYGDSEGIFTLEYALKNYLHDLAELERTIVIKESELFKYSRRFGLTIYEIASDKRDFRSLLQQKGEGVSKEELKLLSFKNYLSQECKSFYKNEMIPLFRRLDAILGVV